jgi:hypothetical protein
VRTHRSFTALQLWREPGAIRQACRADALVAARLEPVVRHGNDEAMVDLTFALTEGFLIVPAILVPTRFVGLRESDPLIWPAAVAEALGDQAADAIRDRLLPWLVAMTAGHPLQGERTTVFSQAHEAAWNDARRRAFLGAAPLEAAWSTLAPYVYARRFARGRSVTLASATAAAGYAALGGVAKRIHVLDLEPATTAAAVSWFGVPFAADDDPSTELIVADAAQRARFAARGVRRLWLGGGEGRAVTAPAVVPCDAAFAFTRSRGVVETLLTVEPDEEPRVAAVVHAPRAGSSGRIVLGLRADATAVPDGDSDEARALAAWLRGDGFDVVVATSATAVAGADLVHVIGLHAPKEARAMLAAAKAAHIPTIVTPQLQDIANEGYWGSEVSAACFALRPDEAGVTMLLELLSQRRLANATANAKSGPPEDYTHAVRDALAMADGVVVAAPGEQRVLRDRYGYQGPVELVAPLLPSDAPAAVRWLAGDEPYGLLLAPLEPRSNALAALRAADRAGIPLVVAGPAIDPAYVALLHEFAYDRGTIVEDPTTETEAGLVAGARVYLDCSWMSRGLSRLVAAAVAGAAVVASSRGWGAELLSPTDAADPADLNSIAAALRNAWTRDPQGNQLAGRAKVLAEPRAAVDRLLTLYARVAARPVA